MAAPNPYILQFQKTDTIAGTSSLAPNATTFNLTTGSFGNPTGQQILIVDYNIPGKAEVILATINGTAVTGITRGFDAGGAPASTAHAAGALIMMDMVPAHYASLVDGTGWASTAIFKGTASLASSFTIPSSPSSTHYQVTGMSVAVTIPTGWTRSLKITGYCPKVAHSVNGGGLGVGIWDGVVGGGLLLNASSFFPQSAANQNYGLTALAYLPTPSYGVHTFNLSGFEIGNLGTGIITQSTSYQPILLVEAV